jgi:hypothetical protein
MTLAATFEAIDVVELVIVLGLAFIVVAVFWALYRRSGERPE